MNRQEYEEKTDKNNYVYLIMYFCGILFEKNPFAFICQRDSFDSSLDKIVIANV